MTTTVPASGALIEERVQTALRGLSSKARKEQILWNKERRALLKNVLFAVESLSRLLAEAHAALTPLFNNADVKDQLFRFFYRSPGGCMSGSASSSTCPFFTQVETEEPNVYSGPLVLAWNICTAEISFKLLVHLTDRFGSGFELRDNFLNASPD